MNEKYPLALNEGSILAGQYIIEGVLGQGGFGITYVAQDHKSGSKVAIKEFFPDTMATRDGNSVMSFTGERAEAYEYGKDCFLQEARTLAQFVDIANIVRIYTYFEENATAYFVMEYVEGESFDEYIKRKGGKISFDEACKLLLPVMDALAAVHDKGIVHRDVTPDNIFICNDGTVKLLDFGAARYSIGDKSKSLDVVLKHGFAPKEQYTRHGRQGAFTDVYSLGATFYYAITGKKLPDSIDRLEEDDMIPPSTLGVNIPEDKEEVLFKAISVQPQDRFQNMRDFSAALKGEVPQNIGQTVAVNPGTAPVAVNLEASPVAQSSFLKKKFVLPSIILGGCVILAAAVIGIIVSVNRPKTNADLVRSVSAGDKTTDENESKKSAAKSKAGGEDDSKEETPTPVPTPETVVVKSISEITDDIGIFDADAISNINNGGYVADAANCTYVYAPDKGLCVYDSNGLTVIGEPYEYSMGNMNVIGNSILYTYGGTVYLMNDDMTENGVCTDFGENVPVRSLYANDIGAFVIEYGDINDSSAPEKLYYKHWETGAQTKPVEIRANTQIAILEDRVMFINADGKLSCWSYYDGATYYYSQVTEDAGDILSISQQGYGSDEVVYLTSMGKKDTETFKAYSTFIFRDQLKYKPESKDYYVYNRWYTEADTGISVDSDYSGYFNFSATAVHNGNFYFAYQWDLDTLGNRNDSSESAPWEIRCFQATLNANKDEILKTNTKVMLSPANENQYNDTEHIPANSGLYDICFSKKYPDVAFVKYISFPDETVKVGVFPAYYR